MEKDKSTKKTYTFNEKEKELGLPVYKMPKYIESKEKAIEIIESGKYGLSEGDFWILMNRNKNKDKMLYSGLIISHNGCLKINDKLENKVNPHCFALDKEGYNNSLVYTYVDDETIEVGEFSTKNCDNSYPYAMAFKRCFDRVVLKKSKLAFSGIYSEVEADEFKDEKQTEEIEEIANNQMTQLKLESQLQTIIDTQDLDYDKICEIYKIKEKDIHFMTVKQLENAIENKDKLPKRIGE